MLDKGSHAGPGEPPGGARWAIRIFILTLAIYLAVLPHRLDVLRPLPIDVPVPTGDEPYYLEIAHSLVYDRDLNLTNNHDIDRDYYRFYPTDLLPHRSQTAQPGHYSKHFPGLALLIAPWYWLGDRFWVGEVTASRAMVAAFMGVIGALLAANVYLLSYEVTASIPVSLAVWAGLAFTNPFLSYSFLIFPALPAALLVIYVYRQARCRGGGRWRSLLTGLALAYLPWLHPRLALLVAPLALYFLLAVRFRHDRLLPFLLPQVASVGLLLAYDYWLYATPLPNFQDHAGLALSVLPAAAVGSLVDQQWGLLIYAPVYAIVAVGLIRSYGYPDPALLGLKGAVRRLTPSRELIWLAILCLPYLLLVLSYRQWWGEWCPPGRYLVPVLPLAAVPLARALMVGPYTRTLYGMLLSISLLIGALLVGNPRLMYNHPTGQAEMLLWLGERLGGLDLVSTLPAIVAPNKDTIVYTIGWLAGFGAALAISAWLDLRWRAQRRPS